MFYVPCINRSSTIYLISSVADDTSSFLMHFPCFIFFSVIILLDIVHISWITAIHTHTHSIIPQEVKHLFMAWCQRWTIDNNNWTSDSSINRNRINHILILVYVNVSMLLYEGHITHKEEEEEDEKKLAKRQQKAVLKNGSNYSLWNVWKMLNWI